MEANVSHCNESARFYLGLLEQERFEGSLVDPHPARPQTLNCNPKALNLSLQNSKNPDHVFRRLEAHVSSTVASVSAAAADALASNHEGKGLNKLKGYYIGVI